jgi:hypothetical protein
MRRFQDPSFSLAKCLNYCAIGAAGKFLWCLRWLPRSAKYFLRVNL